MNKRERTIGISILAKVRERLITGKSRYLCIPLISIGSQSPDPEYQAVAEKLHAWVLTMLGGSHTLGIWLARQKVGYVISFTKESENKIHNTRIAWIDWMIAELERE